MAKGKGLSARQLIESMTMFFEPEAAGGVNAVIQFELSGPDPGDYRLQIQGESASFHLGTAPEPDLTIRAPSDVWVKIADGELDGAKALAEGLYTFEGDPDLLVRFGTIFDAEGEEEKFQAPPGQRPPGPLSISGARWMTLAFLPWIIFWFTFDVDAVTRWVSLGIPFALALATLLYRYSCGEAEWLEVWTVVFFTVSAGLYRLPFFSRWGTVLSQAAMAVIWLATLFRSTPLTCDYIKWGFNRRMWDHTLFVHPNAALTVMWGYQFIAAALLGLAAKEIAAAGTLLTVVRYGLLVPAFIITKRYPESAGERRFVWEKSLPRLRLWAAVGIAAAAALVLFLLAWAPA